MTKNQKAFLDLIAWAEGTSAVPDSDDGYRVIVTSTPEHPILFDNYSTHPRRRMPLVDKNGSTWGWSDAAGRYQLMGRYFKPYAQLLKLPDFSPSSQDAIAIRQILERRAIDDIEAGRIEDAIKRCSPIWASFPGANYSTRSRKKALN